MTFSLTVFLVPLLFAIFLAINMGASGTAPAFSATYGADVIRKEWIPRLYAIFVLLGAAFAGQNVVRAVGGEFVPTGAMNTAVVSIILLPIALSLYASNLLRVPQSTSQATVLALVGCGFYMKNLRLEKLWVVLPTWFLLPCIVFIPTYLCAKFVYYPLKHTKTIDFDPWKAHPSWKILAILASCYVAFSIGSNNVANAAGPLASLVINSYHVTEGGQVAVVMLVATLIIAPWFGIGSFLMGERVLQTTGKEIIEFSPLAAAFISCITATLLLWASLNGIPTSLVQMNTAAIFAVALVKRSIKDKVELGTVWKVVWVWAVAPLFAFAGAFALTALADRLGLLR